MNILPRNCTLNRKKITESALMHNENSVPRQVGALLLLLLLFKDMLVTTDF